MSILLTELLPNIREILAVEFCLRFAYSVLIISSLGFLGLGVQPPTPDWGLMVNEGRNFISTSPWVVLFPALAIGILAISVNIFSDGLWRDRYRLDAARLK
jgi:peptide/nickel transport system permease protein